MMKQLILIGTLATLLGACSSSEHPYDASGTFEAVETIISAETNGTLKALNLEEGQNLNEGAVVAYIDSTQLYLKKKQLEAQIKALLSRLPNTSAQLAALEEQLQQAEREKKRLVNLVKSDAATQKQLDDVSAQVNIISKQIDAQRSTLGITSGGLQEETVPLRIQMEQIQDQLNKCRVVNPVKGTVLAKYVEQNEMAIAGKPLYKIADLSSLVLRAYITGDQFASLKLTQTVTVFTDAASGNSREYQGIVEWMSDKAEFTPKTIQTKDERANLVYAVKIRVKNDGLLKIGMYGEVKF